MTSTEALYKTRHCQQLMLKTGLDGLHLSPKASIVFQTTTQFHFSTHTPEWFVLLCSSFCPNTHVRSPVSTTPQDEAERALLSAINKVNDGAWGFTKRPLSKINEVNSGALLGHVGRNGVRGGVFTKKRRPPCWPGRPSARGCGVATRPRRPPRAAGRRPSARAARSRPRGARGRPAGWRRG